MSKHRWWPWARQNFPPFSYHDVHVTTSGIPRTRIFDLPYGVELRCTRVSGWELWSVPDGDRRKARLLGGEYAYPHEWLVIDVNGLVILDSRGREPEDE